ncbi:hypothetical protein ScPMuIL_017371 [Solemya velum]
MFNRAFLSPHISRITASLGPLCSWRLRYLPAGLNVIRCVSVDTGLPWLQTCRVHQRALSAVCLSMQFQEKSQNICSSRQYCTNQIKTSTSLTENEFEKIVEDTLDSLAELFEALPELGECDKDYDVEFGNGVLTVRVSPSWGTYVINKQTPNKQIWLSSPLSGPKRYDFEDGQWIYRHDNRTLHELLQLEISEAVKQSVNFGACSYSNKDCS